MVVSRETKESPSIPLFIWFIQVITVLVFCCFVIRMCLVPAAPIFAVTNLYVPTTNGGDNIAMKDHVEINQNATIVFSLVITNPNKAKGILYDETKITVYKNGSVLGERSLPGFYQYGRNTVSSVVLVNADQIQHNLKLGHTSENATLKVGLETSVRYRILRWTTKRYLLNLEGSVPVDEDGKLLLGDEGVRLKPVNP